MRKKKEYRKKKFKSEVVYAAIDEFLQKSKIPEDEFHITYEVTKGDLESECKNRAEFFAKFQDADQYHVYLRKDNTKLSIIDVDGLTEVVVDLPNESDVDKILMVFDGKLKPETSTGVNIEKTLETSTRVNIEETLEKHWSKNKKLAIIGIGVTIAVFLIGIVVTNFGIIL